MFWNKKEDKKSLPDLPPLKSPFSQELSPPVSQPLQPAELEDVHKPEEEKNSLPSFPDSPVDKGFSQSAIKEAVIQPGSEEQDESEAMSPIPKQMQGEKSFKSKDVEEQVIEEKESDEPNPYLTSIKSVPKTPEQNKSIPDVPEYKQKEMSMRTNNPFLKPQRAAPSQPMTIQINEDRDTVPLPPEDEEPKFTQKYQPTVRVAKAIVSSNAAIQTQKATTDIFVKIDKFYSAKKSLLSAKQDIEDIDSFLKKIRDTKIKEERELANWEKQIESIKERIQNINNSIFEKTS